MKCNDSRKCIFRDEEIHKGECKILQFTYEKDGQCAFCKKNISDRNGLTTQQAEKVTGEPKRKSGKATATNTYKAVLDRIQLVANRHGAEWRKELKFLEAVKKELKELAELRERYRWHEITRELPDNNDTCLVTVIGDDGVQVREGTFADGDFVFEDAEDMTVFAWASMPEPWEGINDIIKDSGTNEAD